MLIFKLLEMILYEVVREFVEFIKLVHKRYDFVFEPRQHIFLQYNVFETVGEVPHICQVSVRIVPHSLIALLGYHPAYHLLMSCYLVLLLFSLVCLTLLKLLLLLYFLLLHSLCFHGFSSSDIVEMFLLFSHDSEFLFFKDFHSCKFQSLATQN